jgi:hypothetical protein
MMKSMSIYGQHCLSDAYMQKHMCILVCIYVEGLTRASWSMMSMYVCEKVAACVYVRWYMLVCMRIGKTQRYHEGVARCIYA